MIHCTYQDSVLQQIATLQWKQLVSLLSTPTDLQQHLLIQVQEVATMF